MGLAGPLGQSLVAVVENGGGGATREQNRLFQGECSYGTWCRFSGRQDW